MNVANRPSRPSVAKQSKHKSRPPKPPMRPMRAPLRAFGGGATTGLADQKMMSKTCAPQQVQWHLPNWISTARSGGITISRTSDRHSNSGHVKSSLEEKKKKMFYGRKDEGTSSRPSENNPADWLHEISNVVVLFSTCLTIGKLFYSFAREKRVREKQQGEKTSLMDISGQHKHRCMMMMMMIATTRGRERERHEKKRKEGFGSNERENHNFLHLSY
jgi:hypothetical protein